MMRLPVIVLSRISTGLVDVLIPPPLLVEPAAPLTVLPDNVLLISVRGASVRMPPPAPLVELLIEFPETVLPVTVSWVPLKLMPPPDPGPVTELSRIVLCTILAATLVSPLNPPPDGDCGAWTI